MKEKLKIRTGAEGFALRTGQHLRRGAPHHHEELEVNLVLSGKASYLFGNRRVPLLASSMIWLFPKQEHVLMDWSHDFSMWVVVFKPNLVARRSGQGERHILRSGDPGDIFCRQIDSRHIDLLNHVYEGALEEDQDLEFVNAALDYALVASWQAYQFSSESIPRTDVHPAVAKAARLMTNADSSIGLNALAKRSGTQPHTPQPPLQAADRHQPDRLPSAKMSRAFPTSLSDGSPLYFHRGRSPRRLWQLPSISPRLYANHAHESRRVPKKPE